MTDTNVFNADTTITPSDDPLADKLKSIVGADGKPKYANPLVALDALMASQAHIVTLEAEKAQERAEIERLREVERNARSLEDIAEKLQNKNTPPNEVTPKNGVDETTINQLVKNALDARDRQSQAQANIRRVNDALTEKFKDKTVEIVANKAKELGTTPQELGELSSRNPQLVLQLFGSTSTAAPSPNISSINIPGGPPPSNEIKRPEKSLISGTSATDKNRKELMSAIREKVYKDLGVTS